MRAFSQVIADEQGNSVKIFDKNNRNFQNLVGQVTSELRNVVERLIILYQNPVTSEDVAAFVRK